MKNALILATAALFVTGCASQVSQKPVASLPDVASVNAVKGSHIHAVPARSVTTLEVDKPVIKPLTHVRSSALPNTLVGPFAASNMNIVDLMDAIAFESGVGFAFDSSEGSALSEKRISFVDPNKIPFSVAIPRIADSTNMFWSYSNNVLNFETKRSYHVSIPRVAGASELFVKALENVGAENVIEDTSTGGVIFEASPNVYQRAVTLAETWADNRTMIVYDSYIYEVSLNQSASSGISLENLSIQLGDAAIGASSGGTGSVSSNGLALTLSGVGSQVAIDAIAKSLAENGSYKVLSQPTIAVVSGGKASLDVGEKRQYISETSTSTIGDNQQSNVTVSTLSTGLTLGVEGQYSSGMIITDIDLRLATLLGFENFSNGSQELQLPSTAERTVNQTLYARPGDTLVLAGVMTSSVGNDNSGNQILPIFGSKSNNSTKTELVIVLRPRVVQFKSK